MPPALTGLLAAALLVGACASSETPEAGLAQRTCEELETARTSLDRRVAETDLLAAVEDDDDTDLLEVITELSERCPEQAAQLLGGNADGADHDVSLEIQDCSRRETTGTVTNRGPDRVVVRIGVRVVDSDDVLLDTASTVVSELEADQTGRWRVGHNASGSGITCRARVERVTPP